MGAPETQARRCRVRELWIKPDRVIAETLLEEGHGGEAKHTKAGQQKQLASMVRNVINDRIWWRKQWRLAKKMTSEDAHETRGEYLATLSALETEGIGILTDPKMRATPRVQALMALTRIEEAKAKAHGVAEIPESPDGGEDGSKDVPFLGVVVDMSNLTDEAKARIARWTKRDGKKK